jgi:hypothetical protein
MACLSLRSLLAVAVVAVVGSITRVMVAVWLRDFLLLFKEMVSHTIPCTFIFMNMHYFIVMIFEGEIIIDGELSR